MGIGRAYTGSFDDFLKARACEHPYGAWTPLENPVLGNGHPPEDPASWARWKRSCSACTMAEYWFGPPEERPEGAVGELPAAHERVPQQAEFELG